MIKNCGKCKYWKGNLVPSNKSFGYCFCRANYKDRGEVLDCCDFEFKRIEIPECPFCGSKMEYKQEKNTHMLQCTKCTVGFAVSFHKKVPKLYAWNFLMVSWEYAKKSS